MPMFRNGRSFAIQSSCLSVPRTSRSIQLCRIHIPPNPRIPLCKKHKEPCLKKFSGNSLERAAAGYWICSRQHPCDTFIWNNTESISTEINLDFKAAEANLTMHPKLHLYFEALSEHSTIIRGNFTKSAFFLAFKKDQTIEYCSRKSGWVVPWNVKDRLVEKLAQDEVEFRNTYIVDIPQICRFYFSYSRNLSSRSGKTIDKWLQDEETFDVSRIPIWDRLLEFQRQGVQFCVKRHGRAIIGMKEYFSFSLLQFSKYFKSR